MTRRRNRREMSKPSAPPHYNDTTPTTCQPLLHLNQPPSNPLIKLSPQNLQKTLLLQTNPRSNPRRLLITHSNLILKPLIRPPSNQPYPSQSSLTLYLKSTRYLAPFLKLQEEQAGSKLPSEFLPPLLKGNTWSQCNPVGVFLSDTSKTTLQYAHLPPYL